MKLCQVDLVVSVSTSHMAGRGFASRPGHTKDHHKNGTNCLPAWHAMFSAVRLSKRPGSVWNCLWEHALKISRINRKSRESYQMNVIWIQVFLKIDFRGFSIHLYFKDYPTHQGINLRIDSELVYLLTSYLW